MAEARVAVGEGLLRETFAHLRGCGAGERECVVHWTASLDCPGRVGAVLHPDHTATARHYEIEPTWLDATWRQLARERRAIIVQVHTHGAVAFHSDTDDRFPVIGIPGFLSLVLPNFALGPVGLDGAFLAELDRGGRWRELDPHAAIEVIT